MCILYLDIKAKKNLEIQYNFIFLGRLRVFISQSFPYKYYFLYSKMKLIYVN